MTETKNEQHKEQIIKVLIALRDDNGISALQRRAKDVRKRLEASMAVVRHVDREKRAEEEILRIEAAEKQPVAVISEPEQPVSVRTAEPVITEQVIQPVMPTEVQPPVQAEPESVLETVPVEVPAAVEEPSVKKKEKVKKQVEQKEAQKPQPDLKEAQPKPQSEKKEAQTKPPAEKERPSWQGTPRPEIAARRSAVIEQPKERPSWQGTPRPDIVQRRAEASQRPATTRPPWQGTPRPDIAGKRPPYGTGTGTGAPRSYSDRPAGAAGGFGTRTPRPFLRPVAPVILPVDTFNKTKDKKDTKQHDASQKQISKRTLIRRGFVVDEHDEDRGGYRKARLKRKDNDAENAIKIERAIITTENLSVKILSEKIGKPAQEIIKQLMTLGIMTTINSVVDFPTMELVADALGVKIELKLDKTKEEQLFEFHDEASEAINIITRPPIVTIMGHVDHGKTSLLDRIKKTNVVDTEAGGITQHIGAYSVTLDGKNITFIDTPGHEAFSAMRARGAQVTDIAIIVVAADDGIMPQTVEAINHAKAAKVPIVVAVNKIDKPGASAERIKQQLTEHDVLCEEWGGDVPVECVSAKTGDGIQNLLRSILAVAEVADLRADPDRKARGTIIEARLDKGKGTVATIIIQNGTLHTGDTIVSGFAHGRIRAMYDDKGKLIKQAGPSFAVSVVGFQSVPEAGAAVLVVDDEKMAKQVAQEREAKQRESLIKSTATDIDELFKNKGKLKNLNLIIKADVQGSVEAVKASLSKLANSEVNIAVIHSAVGAITPSDINLAVTSGAEIIGFNVRPDNDIKTLAETSGVTIKLYRIIYEAIEDIEKQIKGMSEPVFNERVIGHAEVRAVYRITGVGAVAGCYVTNGKAIRNAKVRILRDSVIVYESTLDSLKRFKDDVKEVAAGYECGIGVVNYNDIKEKDVLEFYVSEQV